MPPSNKIITTLYFLKYVVAVCFSFSCFISRNRFRANDDADSDVDNDVGVLLVHGVFGSGKSTLLVVCVLLIMRVAALSGESGAAVRVLIASATNVAGEK